MRPPVAVAGGEPARDHVPRPETPIDELPLGWRPRLALRAAGLLRLADLATLRRSELATFHHVGPATIAKLRRLLRSVGLDFVERPDRDGPLPAHNRALLCLPPQERALARRGVPDRAPITRLGLRPQTLLSASRHGWATVGELRERRFVELARGLGMRGCGEVVEALRQTGRDLRHPPTPIEQWRCGLLEVDALPAPQSEATPVEDLEPWLGAAVIALREAGIDTLGHLRACAAQGGLRHVPRVGAVTCRQLLEFLHTADATRRPRRRRSGAAAGATAVSSVFELGTWAAARHRGVAMPV